MRVLFIGGTGNISAECAALLHQRGHEVLVLSRGQAAVPPAYRAIRADRKDPAAMRAALKGVHTEVVINFLEMGQPIAWPICGGERRIQEDTPAGRAQFGCAGTEPPSRAKSDCGYDQRRDHKWPKLWVDPFPAQLGTRGDFWLDTDNPYISSPVPKEQEWPVELTDNPGVPDVYPDTTTISDTFIDYVVFCPSEGGQENNIYVTLGIVRGGNPSWAWSATSVPDWVAGTVYWNVQPGWSVTTPTEPDDSNAFPQWLHTLSY